MSIIRLNLFIFCLFSASLASSITYSIRNNKINLIENHFILNKSNATIKKEQSIFDIHRLKFISGDIFKDSFGAEFDTVFLSNVLHIYNPRENTTLFRKIYKALNKGGRFILYDLFLKDNQIEPYDASLFAITMLLYTKTGKSYTFSEVELLLRDAGFVGFKRLRAEHGSSLIEARKA